MSAKTFPTYVAEAALAGANNKDMLSILNPIGSGKVVKVWEVWATVTSASGATVIVPFEMRRATAVTAGTIATAGRYDSADPAPSAVVRSAPTSISDGTPALMWTWVEQINTAQGSTDSTTAEVSDAGGGAQTRGFTLREGEALYLRQIANNTSTFRMGVLWTEE